MSEFRRRLMMALGSGIKSTTLKGRGRISWQGAFPAELSRVVVYGEGKQDGTPAPDAPIEPVFLEEASLLGSGKNLLNQAALKAHTFLGVQTGEEEYRYNSAATDFIRIPQYEDLVGSFAGQDNLFMLIYDDKKSYIGYRNAGAPRPDKVRLVNIPGYKKAKYCRICISTFETGKSKDYWLGPDNTLYEPYIDLGTAPLPILRALPDSSARDVMDVVGGIAWRNVQAEKLYGTETVTVSPDSFIVTVPTSAKPNVPVISDFFSGAVSGPDGMVRIPKYSFKTVEEFKAFLAEKKPTLWYPPETPMAEKYDKVIFRQHPGYTQLIQQGGFREAEIEADVYEREEVTS